VHPKKTLQLAPGDEYAVRCAGGAGYGDPHERAPETVLRDVRGGYVSVAAANAVYGVALTPQGDVDQLATSRLRKRRAEGGSSR
jgi:N-methylhydantoinase B